MILNHFPFLKKLSSARISGIYVLEPYLQTALKYILNSRFLPLFLSHQLKFHHCDHPPPPLHDLQRFTTVISMTPLLSSSVGGHH
jgi:hypothetical protein